MKLQLQHVKQVCHSLHNLDNLPIYSIYSIVLCVFYYRVSVRFVLHSNTAVNVLVYAGRLKEFRDAIRQDMEKIACCRPNNTRVRHSSIPLHSSLLYRGPQAQSNNSPVRKDEPSCNTILTHTNSPVSGRSKGGALEDQQGENIRDYCSPQMESGQSNVLQIPSRHSQSHCMEGRQTLSGKTDASVDDQKNATNYQIRFQGNDLPCITVTNGVIEQLPANSKSGNILESDNCNAGEDTAPYDCPSADNPVTIIRQSNEMKKVTSISSICIEGPVGGIHKEEHDAVIHKVYCSQEMSVHV